MLPSLFSQIDGAPDSRRDRVITLLRALNISRVTYSLNGEGDSGECCLSEVEYADGRSTSNLPEVPIGFSAIGAVHLLPYFVEELAADLPEGDWVNNEGGYGTVTIHPFEDDLDARFDCEMTYRTYYDEDDDEFEDLELDDEPVAKPSDDAVPPIRIEEAGQ